MNLTELYCHVDDLYRVYELQCPKQIGKAVRCQMHPSEMLTVVLWFPHTRMQNFKSYYHHVVEGTLRRAFPALLSYGRFVEHLPSLLAPLKGMLLNSFSSSDGVSYIDGSSLRVCENTRASGHRVWKGVAGWGRSATKWAFGLKLHLVINRQGELLATHITPGNRDERKPARLLLQNLGGTVYADKGYVSKALRDGLASKPRPTRLVARPKKNMKATLSQEDKAWMSARGLIETVIGHLKAFYHLEHTRHRSPVCGMVHLTAALLSYQLQPNKPSLPSVRGLSQASTSDLLQLHASS